MHGSAPGRELLIYACIFAALGIGLLIAGYARCYMALFYMECILSGWRYWLGATIGCFAGLWFYSQREQLLQTDKGKDNGKR